MAVEINPRLNLEQVMKDARKERVDLQREYYELKQQMHAQQELFLMETMQFLRGWYKDLRRCLEMYQKGTSERASLKLAQMDREVDRVIRQHVYEVNTDSLRSPRYWWQMDDPQRKFVIYQAEDENLQSALPKAKWNNQKYKVYEYRGGMSVRTEISYRIRWIAGKALERIQAYEFERDQCMEKPVEWSAGMNTSFSEYEGMSEKAAGLAQGLHELEAVDVLGLYVFSERDQLEDLKTAFVRETIVCLSKWYHDFYNCVTSDEATVTGQLVREGKGEVENLRRDVERLRSETANRVMKELEDKRLWRHMQDLSQRYELLDVHDERQEKDEIHKRIRKVAREIFPYLTRRGYKYTNCWENKQMLRWTSKMDELYKEYGRLSESLDSYLESLHELWQIHLIGRSRYQMKHHSGR